MSRHYADGLLALMKMDTLDRRALMIGYHNILAAELNADKGSVIEAKKAVITALLDLIVALRVLDGVEQGR